MASHRSPSFDRLKERLAVLPARIEAEIEEERGSSALAVSAPDIRSTAAVQQMTAPPRPETPSIQTSLHPKPGKAKIITRPSTFRLSLELQEALRIVSEHNRINMTDVVAEGVWFILQNLQWPDHSEELRIKLTEQRA